MTCPAIHPEKDLQCERPVGNHPLHTAYVPTGHGPEPVDWPNTAYQPPSTPEQRSSTRKRLRQAVHDGVSAHEAAKALSEPRVLIGAHDSAVQVAAAALALPRSGTNKRIVFDLVRQAGDHGVTFSELDAELGWTYSRIGPRMRDLEDLGLVAKSGQTRRSLQTTAQQEIYRVTPEGERV